MEFFVSLEMYLYRLIARESRVLKYFHNAHLLFVYK